ncbi:MAG: hypothetical protein QXK33_01840 [Candidatus Bathyarchaeia archaeon]
MFRFGRGRMEKITVVLAVVNILVAIGPLAGTVLVHVDNPIEVVIPPEVQELNESMGSMAETLRTIELVNVTYDSETRTLTIIFGVTSRLNVNLEINNIEADVVCVTHGYLLGHAYLSSPVTLEPGRRSLLMVVSQWTVEAEQHIRNQHAGESTIDVDLVNFVVDVLGIVVRAGEPIRLKNVPIVSIGG